MKFLLCLLIMSSSLSSFANERVIRVACVGDSITWGMTVKDRSENCYPKKLERLLGKNFKVINFGSNGATCLRSTPDKTPYVKREAYKKSFESQADIIVIMLGANDSKPIFWDRENYVKDYRKLVSEYRAKFPKAKIYLCTPVSCYTQLQGPWDCNEGKLSVARMLLKQLSEDLNCELIDVHRKLKRQQYFSPDGVHPNADGAAEIAKVVHTQIK